MRAMVLGDKVSLDALMFGKMKKDHKVKDLVEEVPIRKMNSRQIVDAQSTRIFDKVQLEEVSEFQLQDRAKVPEKIWSLMTVLITTRVRQ